MQGAALLALVLPGCVAVCCSLLQSVAVCCGVLRCVAVCCGVLQCVAMCCNVLQCGAVCCSVLQCVAVCCGSCSVLQRVVVQCATVCCSVLQCAVVCCNVLQCVAECCSVLQRVAACCSVVQRGVFSKVCCKVVFHSSYTGRVANMHRISKVQVFSRKRAAKKRAPLRKMTYQDKASYGSSPRCSKYSSELTFENSHRGNRASTIFLKWQPTTQLNVLHDCRFDY